MKRAREEEGEEEQAAPAPMASSPARNPGIRGSAAPTPSGTGHGRVVTNRGRVLTWDDAVDFVLSVRSAFDRAKYHEFLNVIRRIDSIGVRGVVDRMKVLLRGHPDLKRHFNMFLPAQYKLSLTDDDQ